MNPQFWRGKSVLITGHTGFKGSWLALWLQGLGARVGGYALAPPTRPSLFELAQVGAGMASVINDVRDPGALQGCIADFKPEIIIHMAAQSLVRHSYQHPMETYATNVMGTVNLLEAARSSSATRAVLVVTSDKCYENKEWLWGYRENEALGGYDPYSNSKACAELVVAAYRHSFFNPDDGRQALSLASARAGNVIGGGDWAKDRLIADVMAAFLEEQAVRIRNPQAVRPWQHVLEPLNGYLILAEKLWTEGADYAEAWNFGPDASGTVTVAEIMQRLKQQWHGPAGWVADSADHPHEAACLKLDCAKARARLGWRPRLSLDETLAWIVEWYEAYRRGDDVRRLTETQINRYQEIKV